VQNISAYLALELLINGWIHVPVSRRVMYRFLTVGFGSFDFWLLEVGVKSGIDA
jgi:hypothetical protein